MWAFARVRKDSVTSPLFQLALVTTSLVIFCQCIYLALCIIRGFFRPQHCCEAVNYSIQYVSPPSFSPAFEINSLKRSFVLPSLHHHLSLVKPGNGFSSSLAEVPPAMGILMFHTPGVITFVWCDFLGRERSWADKEKHLNPPRASGSRRGPLVRMGLLRHSPFFSGRDHTCSTRTKGRARSHGAGVGHVQTGPVCCWCWSAQGILFHCCVQRHESFRV